MTDLQATARLAISLMDLTSLNLDDNDERIQQLCSKAQTSVGETAAVCVYPAFIKTAKQTLAALNIKHVKVATVTNFPEGHADIDAAVTETQTAVIKGADEVDVVFPYRALIAGNSDVGFELVKQCRLVCGDRVLLKVIIESGELKSADLINQAATLSIEAGADFIKTSTGKVPVNATVEAAEVMLQAIKQSGRSVGFKAAGGVRNAEDAARYISLAQNIMGRGWVTPDHFRFGASSLLTSLIETLAKAPAAGQQTRTISNTNDQY